MGGKHITLLSYQNCKKRRVGGREKAGANVREKERKKSGACKKVTEERARGDGGERNHLWATGNVQKEENCTERERGKKRGGGEKKKGKKFVRQPNHRMGGVED